MGIGGDLDLVDRDPQGLNAHLGVSLKKIYSTFWAYVQTEKTQTL